MRRILRYRLVLICMMLVWQGVTQAGLLSKYENYIYYHCADWGPNEDGTDEKIYFIKQIIFSEDDMRYGNDVYFCSMNADGSDKKEIKQLWQDTKMLIDINGNTSFIDICWKTKQAAIAFSAGDEAQTGLWLINLDGTGLKRILEQTWTKDFRGRINHPSWFPDGKHLIYQERWVHTSSSEFYIVKVDIEGKNKIYLTNGEKDGRMNMYPVVSSDGKQIAYHHSLHLDKHLRETEKSGLWLMNGDGFNKRLLYTNISGYADYPEWSPDGSKIYVVKSSDFVIVDAITGKEKVSKLLRFDEKYWIPRKVHWSKKYGYVLDGGGSIGHIKKDLSYYVAMGTAGGMVETKGKRDLSLDLYKWGKRRPQNEE